MSNYVRRMRPSVPGKALYTLAAATLVLLLTTFAFGQGTRASIRGKVTDPNGAIVAGATVRLIDVAKKTELRNVTTNEEGEYQFLEVEPATYDITITTSGFAESKFSNVKVEPNRNLQLDTQLTIGTTTEEVTVTASQELIDRESPTLGTTVEQRRVVGLPLNGRNVLDLALLQPGVVPANNNQVANAFGGGSGIRVNGARGVENNITLDGSNNNEVAVGGTSGVQPRPDAVQEFRLLTSVPEAEFGRNSGAVINVVTKSGTNDFHGNIRAFYRPTVLSAARYFDQNDPTDLPRPGTTNDFRRRFERKEFGGQIGGPIYVPHFGEGGPFVHSGKNRHYFFVDYEGRRQLIGNSQTITGIPTAEERLGIFTRPASDPLIDPALSTTATRVPFPIISTSGTTIRQQIPTGRFSPIAQYYLGFLPLANAAGQASAVADEVENADQWTARTDFLLTQAQNLNITYNYFDRSTDTPFAFGGSTIPGFGAVDLRTTRNVAVRHTWSLSSRLVNSFLAGYARNNQPGTAPKNSTPPSQIGFTGNFVANDTFAGPPRITFNERGFNLGNTIQGPQARVTENFQLQDSVSFASGNHRFKFGFDGTYYKQDQAFLFVNQGILTFSGTNGGNTTGDDLADFLIGNSPVAVQFGANGLRDYRQHAVYFFGQDTWRVSNNLTLSLGLRYEYTSPLTDKFNRVAYYRRGAVSQLLTSGQLRSFEGIPITVPAGGRAPNGLVFVGDPDPVLGGTVPAGGIERDLNNFAPRVGFAYTPNYTEGFGRTLFGDNATVIRGGFGVFYGAIVGDTALQQLSAPGFNGTNFFQFPACGTLANPFAPDPFPAFSAPGEAATCSTVPNPFAASAFNISAPLGQFSRPIDPHLRTPYTYQYNLTVERGFWKNYVASLSYVGSRGLKLYALEQVNPAVGTFIPTPAGLTVPAATRSNANARRINQDIQIGLSQTVSAGNSFYNALQANLTRRYSNGLLFQVAYTFSKNLTDSDTLRGALDLLDRRRGYGLSNDDIPHRFVASFIYDLPFFNKRTDFVNRVFGGWSIGGIYQAQSGTPFTVANPTDTTGCGGACLSFADLGAAFTHLDPRANQERAFNADAFRVIGPIANADFPTQFRFGTSGNNQFRAQNGVNNFDAILSKRTRITESSNFELRLEAFNAFNHTQFTILDTNISNIVRNADGTINPNRSSFGKFTNARESRVVQIGARLNF